MNNMQSMQASEGHALHMERIEARVRAECYEEIGRLKDETARLKEQLAEANNERAWVRRKLGIPEDCGFLSGEVTLAGTMHCACNAANGYRKYIETEKCDDKLGEIARMSVRLAEAQQTCIDHAEIQSFLHASNVKLRAALVECVEAFSEIIEEDQTVMFNRCPDCDYNCKGVCKDMPLSNIGKVADKALTNARSILGGE